MGHREPAVLKLLGAEDVTQGEAGKAARTLYGGLCRMCQGFWNLIFLELGNLVGGLWSVWRRDAEDLK